MLVITARNTNEMTAEVIAKLGEHGVLADSRNGPVYKFPFPVTFHYTAPWERVNLVPERDANPFFHVMEAMAMLSNVNSVHYMTYYNKNMIAYSDDGERYNAFYGERMLDMPFDQLSACIVQLNSDPKTRAAVIQLWHPMDLITSTVDRACNISMVFNRRPSGQLDLTIFNRSNDLVWGGVSGANIVHFSMFHEIVSRATGMTMGEMFVVSNDAHVYTDNGAWKAMCDAPNIANPEQFDYEVQPVGEVYSTFMSDVHALTATLMTHNFPLINTVDLFTDPFVSKVAIPIHNAWHCRKAKDLESMWSWIQRIEDDAWNMACSAWVQRRDGDAPKKNSGNG